VLKVKATKAWRRMADSVPALSKPSSKAITLQAGAATSRHCGQTTATHGRVVLPFDLVEAEPKKTPILFARRR
jgi:hypothetical protein